MHPHKTENIMAKKTYIHPEMEIELLENVDVLTLSQDAPSRSSGTGFVSLDPVDSPKTSTEPAPSTNEVTTQDPSDVSETPTSEPEAVVESAPVEGAGPGEMVP